MTEMLDFSRSFAGWKSSFNWTRIQVEAVCDLIEGQNVDRYVLVASCKAERTYADRNLIHQPNWDFCAIFGQEDFLLVRTFITTGQVREREERQPGRIRDYFGLENLHLVCRPATILRDAAEVVKGTLSNRPISVRTELADPSTGQRAVLEYPVKTMNILPPENRWQVDTGPILVPNFSCTRGRPIERLDLAFSIFNRFDETEFILRRPTPIEQNNQRLCEVMYYSHVRVFPATNTLLCAQE